MSKLIFSKLEELRSKTGQEIGVSDWIEIDQERINGFARATNDHQWIHVDVARAEKESPLKSTIAHGYLTLSLLAGFAIDGLVVGLSKRRSALTTAVFAVLMLVEFHAYPFTGVPFAVNPPAIDRWLDTQPKPFVVAEVPVPSIGDLGALERHQTRSMFHATAHWQKTVHGYSSLRRPLHDQLYLELTAFPDATSITSLQSVGVTHIVVHTGDYGDRWRGIEDRIAMTPELRLLHVEGEGRVYSLSLP